MPDQIQNNPFNRPPRIQHFFKGGELDIPAPPSKPDEDKENLLSTLLPMSSFIVMGVFYSLMFRGTGMGSGWLYVIMMTVLALFTVASTLLITSIQKHKRHQAWIKSLREYHRTLDKKEARLHAARLLQLEVLENAFQSPSQLLKQVQNLEISLWEKRPEDEDYLQVRIGKGDIDSKVIIKSPDPDLNNPEIRRPIGIYQEYRKIPNAPFAIDGRKVSSLAIVGRRNLSLGLARALISQFAAKNSPEEVKLFLFSSESCYSTWQWLRWLPHVSQSQISGQPEYLAFTRRMNKNLISHLGQVIENASRKGNEESKNITSELARVLVFDKEIDIRDESIFSEILKNGNRYNVFSILLCNSLEDVPSTCQSIISLQGDAFIFSQVGIENHVQKGKTDSISALEVENLANRLLPIAIRTQGLNARVPVKTNLLQTYQVNTINELDIIQKWKRLPQKNGLLPFPVLLGNETYATPFSIHLAENCDGPHGLIAGTTGSGKSELIQTFVSSLALEHHPYFVNFLLIDFKGGSTFRVFEHLPHVVGMVSNLDKSTAVRALEAIKAEIIHRETFLKKHNATDINEYHNRLSGLADIPQDWEPLPHLFIIVDEFAQMAQEMPDFLPEIVATGRLGRSLGVHLILATQRPAGVVNDEMRANLNFRICLRVQSVDDSRDMLLRPDAAYLPHNLPGRAFFQLGDGGNPRQFQVARSAVADSVVTSDMDFLYRLEYEQKVEIISPKEEKQSRPTICSTLVENISRIYSEKFIARGYQKPSPILLDPLPTEIQIDKIFESHVMPDSRLERKDDIRIPIGIIDSLSTKTQPPQWIDFSEFGGHVIAIGGPQSGKTGFLKSLAYGLCKLYTPAEISIYALSFAGRELEILDTLPHVGAIVYGGDSERFHRLLRFLQNQIENRKTKFGEMQSQDLNHYNASVQPDEKLANIFVLIDNFGELRNTDYVDELLEIERLIQVGRIYGVYFILTALQANDISYRITNLIQNRFVFNLADHTEYLSLIGRPDTLDFDTLPKGRCFVSGTTPPLQCQIGMPPDKEQWKIFSDELTENWGDRVVPSEIGILKPLVYLSDNLHKNLSGHLNKGIEIGVDGDTLSGFILDLFSDNPHYLIGGSPQSGRTSLLQSIVLTLAYQFTPEQVQMVLVDGSGKSLSRLKNLPHVIDWVKEEDGLTRNIANLESELSYRRSGKKAGLNSHIFFIMDDYDQLTEAISIGDEILLKLSRHIRQDSDLAFHFIIAVSTDFLAGDDPLIKQIRLLRSGISLSSFESLEIMGGNVTNSMRNQILLQGRGYVFSRLGNHLVQFANPDNLAFQILEEKWKGRKSTQWEHPATDDEISVVREESAPVVNRQRTTGKTRVGSFIDQEESLRRYLEQKKKTGAL